MSDDQKKLDNLIALRNQHGTKAAYYEKKLEENPHDNGVRASYDQLLAELHVANHEIRIIKDGMAAQAKKEAEEAKKKAEEEAAAEAIDGLADDKDKDQGKDKASTLTPEEQAELDEIAAKKAEATDDELVKSVKEEARKADAKNRNKSQAQFISAGKVDQLMESTNKLVDKISEKPLTYKVVSAASMGAVVGGGMSVLGEVTGANAVVSAGAMFMMGGKDALKESYKNYKDYRQE
jgi:hypothetical protein